MTIDAFEANKENSRTSEMVWLRQLPIVTYGYVANVIDERTVKVVPVVQDTSSFVRTLDVTLLNLSSSLMEIHVQPQVKDLVMLFSLNSFDAGMFDPITLRPEGSEVLVNTANNGYSVNSMVGILMTTFRAVAAVQLTLSMDEGNPLATLDFGAKTNVSSAGSFNFTLSSRDGKEHPVHVTINEKRPAKFTQRSSLHIRAGYGGAADDVHVDAPTIVERGKKAPYDMTNEAATTLNFKEDAPLKINSETHVDVDSKEPVGINAGLRKEALKPYWDAERSACESLRQAATLALVPAALLDGMSGQTTFIIGLVRELIAFTNALAAADRSANNASEPIIK